MDTRNRILCSASELFAQRGYERTSMDAIAQNADVTKGALYYFFKNKSELFLEIVQAGLDLLQSRIDACIAQEESPQFLLRKIIEVCVDMCLDYPEYARVVLSANFEQLDDELGQRVRELLENHADIFMKILEYGIEQGVIAPTDPELTTTAFIGILAGMVARQIAYSEPPSRGKMVDSVCHIVLFGLLPREGCD